MEGCTIVAAGSTSGGSRAVAVGATAGARVLLETAPLLAVTLPGASVDAERAAAALVRGLHAGGIARCDVLQLDHAAASPDLVATRAAARFQERLHRARALVILTERLEPQGLASSAAFELATRARQGGVPCSAVTRTTLLGPFERRILDLQEVLEAPSDSALLTAGGLLAATL